MTDTTELVEQDRGLDSLGPVDYIVVEFPAGASNFTGEMAEELVRLVDAGIVRVIDVLILSKDEDGTIDAMELSDIPELGELETIEAQLAELLAAEDVEHLAAAMEPGSTAGVLIGELVGRAVRIGGTALGRPTDRQRTDSYPGDHRLHRGGQRTCDGRSLRCQSGQRGLEGLGSSARRWQRPRWWQRL